MAPFLEDQQEMENVYEFKAVFR